MANQNLYGFHTLQTIFNQIVDDVDVRVLNKAVTDLFEEHNRVTNSILDIFVRRTTEFKIVYTTAASARLQPLDANGRVLPVRSGAQYERAFPIKEAGHAWGMNNREARMRRTVQDLQLDLDQALDADANWLLSQILGALFTNVSYTVTDPENRGSLTIKPLANQDGELYWRSGGAAAPQEAQHFLAQASTIDDLANPFSTAKETLRRYPDNGRDVIAIINGAERADTEALQDFFPERDPRINTGVATDTLASTPSNPTPGDYVGYASGVDVFVWDQQPAGYITFVATGGEPPIAMRESDLPAMRGFRAWADRADAPWFERQFQRKAGFGVWNRTAALVYRVGNASYAIPTGYTQPFA